MPVFSLKAKFRNLVTRVRERTGFFIFYVLPQLRQVTYEVSIKNLSNQTRNFFLVMPETRNLESQELKSTPKFDPQVDGIGQDVLLKNKYVIWQVSLQKEEAKTFRQSFEILTLPSPVLNLHQNFSFEDYKNVDEQISKNFCSANRFINADDHEIKKLARKLKGKDDDVIRVLKRINEFVIQDLEYADPILGLYSAKEALTTKKVDCGGFDALFCAICIALGVPARVVSGFWAGYGKNSMHAWAEFMLPHGQWVPVDPSVEQFVRIGKTKKAGRFGFVGSDRVTLSIGCDIPLLLNGEEIRTDILQNPFIYPREVEKDLDMNIQFLTHSSSGACTWKGAGECPCCGQKPTLRK